MSEATLIWAVLFGAIGLGYFVYGRKQRAVVPLVCGLALMAYPYFVSGSYLVPGVGLALMATPWLLRP